MAEESHLSKFAFGPFVLDVPGRKLLKNGRPVPLGSRAFGVLVELTRQPGVALPKETLLDRVWPEVGIGEEALAQAVHELRTALGDNPRSPTYVQTVHGFGYCFIAPVLSVAERAGETTLPSPRRAVLSLLASALALLGATLALSLLLSRPVARPTTTRPEVVPLVRLPGGAWKPSFAPNSAYIAVVSSDAEGYHSLFLVRKGLPQALQITHRRNVRGPAPTFTPDSNWLLFTEYRGGLGGIPDVWRVPVLGGQPELVAESASAAHVHPSGNLFAFAKVTLGGTSIVVRKLDGSELTVASRGFWPRWSPDGQWLAYTSSDPEGGDGALFVVRPDGREVRQLTWGSWQFYGLDWTPKPLGIVFSASRGGPFRLWWVDVRGGPPQPITTGAGDDTCPAVAPDGSQLLFVNGRMRGSVLYAEDKEGPFTRLAGGENILGVALAPRSRKVAIVSQSFGTGNVRVVEAATGREAPLSHWHGSRARWAPAEFQLLLAGFHPDFGEVVALVDWPENRAKVLVPDCPCDWPDLRHNMLSFVRREGTSSTLLVRDLASGQEEKIASASEIMAVRLSPTGRFVAWSGYARSTDPASAGIWVSEVREKAAPRRIAPEGTWPVWGDNDRTLLFLRTEGAQAIWQADLSTGVASRLRSIEVAEVVETFDAGGPSGPFVLGVHLDSPQVFAMTPIPLGDQRD